MKHRDRIKFTGPKMDGGAVGCVSENIGVLDQEARNTCATTGTGYGKSFNHSDAVKSGTVAHHYGADWNAKNCTYQVHATEETECDNVRVP